MSTALLPRDFVHSTVAHEWTHNEFNSGTLRHIVAVLGQRKALFVIDGLTYEGRALSVRQTPGYGTFQVVIECELSDGTVQRTAFSDCKFQVVIPLEEQDFWARFTVSESIRLEERAVRDELARRHAATEGKLSITSYGTGLTAGFISEPYDNSACWIDRFSASELAELTTVVTS